MYQIVSLIAIFTLHEVFVNIWYKHTNRYHEALQKKSTQPKQSIPKQKPHAQCSIQMIATLILHLRPYIFDFALFYRCNNCSCNTCITNSKTQFGILTIKR